MWNCWNGSNYTVLDDLRSHQRNKSDELHRIACCPYDGFFLLYAAALRRIFLKYDNYLLKNDKNMLTKNNSDDMMVSNGGWKNLTEVCYERER